MIERHTLTLPHGISLECRSSGERGRPVLLFLHGFPEAAFVWDELLAHFAQPKHGGYRCVAPNLRGFEQSSAPADVAAYRAKPLVQDLTALIRLMLVNRDVMQSMEGGAALRVGGGHQRQYFGELNRLGGRGERGRPDSGRVGEPAR